MAELVLVPREPLVRDGGLVDDGRLVDDRRFVDDRRILDDGEREREHEREHEREREHDDGGDLLPIGARADGERDGERVAATRHDRRGFTVHDAPSLQEP